MVKTLLKSVLIVLVLAGVFFFAFQMWEKRQAKELPPPMPTPAPTIEMIPTAIPTAEPTAAPLPMPTATPVSKKHSAKPTSHNKKSTKSKKAAAKPKKQAKKSTKKTKRHEETALSPSETEPLIPDMSPPSQEVKPDASAEPPQKPADNGPVNLDELFNETQANNNPPPSPPTLEAPPEDVPPAEIPPSEGPPSEPSTEVASLPPASDGKFDTSKPAADLPKVTGLSVRDDGGVTTISIDREKKSRFKLFRLVNPSRVVVDFQNAANALQSEYPAFSGTRVKKVTTQQFPGKDETITRVMIFIEGLPKVEPSISGNSLVLRLP